MPGLLQLRANLAADISHVVSFREVKLDFELYYKMIFVGLNGMFRIIDTVVSWGC